MGSMTKVITFLKSPLVTWIKTFREGDCSNSDQVGCFKLFDGVFLHSVWHQIETNGSFHSHTTIDETGDSIVSRIRNLSSLLYKIRTFYSDSLGQILVLRLPDVVNIGRDPEDECNLEDLGTLLLLLLGSAVQCESKERFIEAITALDLSVQHSIVECIRQITDNPSSVWSNNDWGELSLIPDTDQPRMYSTLVANVNRLAKERDDLAQRVVELVIEMESLKSKGSCSGVSSSHSHHRHHSTSHLQHIPSSLPPSPSGTTGSGTSLASSPPPVGPDGSSATPNVTSSLYNSYSSSSVSSLLTLNNNESRSHLVVELAEAKSKYRKVVAELEEKSELVNELKENLEQSKETCNKLRSENLELIQEARSAKAYRDEIDVLNERVRKVDRLENEVQRYRDKINELIFYKSRVEEMREDNRILSETKTMLEEQLECSRKRSEQIPELEAQLLQLRAYSNEIQFQRDMDRDKIDSLMEEVTSLQVEKKAVIEELAQVQKELNSLRCQYTAIEPIVSPIGLESNLFEQLNNDAAKRVLKLELENQKLHSLVENIRNKETSVISNNSSSVKQQQTSSLDSFSSSSASEKGESTSPSQQLLDDGSNYSTTPASGNDSGCVSLVGELNSRLEKMEKENLRLKGTIEQLRECEDRIMELESAKTGQEKELSTLRENLHEEVCKTETLERSLSNLTAENARLTRQVDHLTKRLEDCSQEIQALEGENSKLQGTALTLRNTVKRLNDLEREVTHLEAENHRLEQERKSNEKEISRLRQALEAKDSLIDEQANKISSLELERKQMSKELDSINTNAMNIKELEREKQELAGDLEICKKSLTALRQDLVEEKIKSQSLSSEMERIYYAMSQMSLKPSLSSSLSSIPNLTETTISLSTETSFDLPPFSSASIGKVDWSDVMEKLLESMIRRNLESKESRISVLENNLKEVESRKTKLKDELTAMKEKISKSQIVSDNKSLESSLDVMIEEMEKRLKAAEEENKLLRGDNLSLQESRDQLREQVKSLQDKVECMSRESNYLHSDTAKAQVENSLLVAERTSLSSQTAHLQAEIRLLEEARDSIEEKYKELEESYQSLINDHQSLQGLHQQLVTDYESLLDNHNSLKSNYKSLKQENKEVKEKLEVWLLSNEELKKMLKDGNDCGKCKKMVQDNGKLVDEKKQLVEDFRRVETELKMVQNIYKQLRKENNELKLRNTELEGETAECRQSMSSLQVEVSKLSSYCESLGSSNNLLEEQRRTLIRNVLNLLGQYHILISEMASREFDKAKSADRIAELGAKKERLERMIRDYDTMSERERKKIRLPSDVNGIRSSTSRHNLNGSSFGDSESDNNRLPNYYGTIDEKNPASAFTRVIKSKQQIPSPTTTSGILSSNNSSLTSPISEFTSPSPLSSSSSSLTSTKTTTPTPSAVGQNSYYDNKPWQPLSTVNASATTTASCPSQPSNILVNKKASTPTSLLSTPSLVSSSTITTTTKTPSTSLPLSSSIISRSRRENPIGEESPVIFNESRRGFGSLVNDSNGNQSPPPRLPPRHNTITAQVDNRMTINVITSPLGNNSRAPLPGDSSSLTPPLPKSAACNFVRSTFRSSSINMGSPLKRGYLKDDYGSSVINHHHVGELSSGELRGSHHHHYLHHHHPLHPHLHLTSYPNEPCIHSDDESELSGATTGDRLLTSNNLRATTSGSSNHHHHLHHHHHHLVGSISGGGGVDGENGHQSKLRQDDSDSTINSNNSTWYEYGCV